MRLITCSRCGELKELLAKNLCELCYGRNYNETHREEIRQRQKRWYLKHRERLLPKMRAYNQERRKRIAEEKERAK